MISYPTEIEKEASHIELAFLSFDQWNLNISIRKYSGDSVIGMTQLVFQSVVGFRYLDEGDMLNYRFPEDATRHYCHEVTRAGWLQQEVGFKNVLPHEQQVEYLIATSNECVCVIAYKEPILLRTGSS